MARRGRKRRSKKRKNTKKKQKQRSAPEQDGGDEASAASALATDEPEGSAVEEGDPDADPVEVDADQGDAAVAEGDEPRADATVFDLDDEVEAGGDVGDLVAAVSAEGGGADVDAGERSVVVEAEDEDAAADGETVAEADDDAEAGERETVAEADDDAEAGERETVAGADDDAEAGERETLPEAADGEVVDATDRAGGAASTEAAELTPAGDAADSATAAEGDGPEEDVGDVPDFDLGPTSTPEARARLLAEALAHAEMSDARYRVPTESRRVGRIKAGIALAVFMLAAIFLAYPPELVRPDAAARPLPADRRVGIVATIALQAQQVEAYRTEMQRLPNSLEDVELRVPGVRYVRSSNRLYQLIGYTPDGNAVVYDSAAPSAEFAAALPWHRSRDGS